MFILEYKFFNFRFVRGIEWYEFEAWRNTEIFGHVPWDKETDLPKILFLVQWWLTGNPWTVQKPQGCPATSQEVFWQHQTIGDDQGKNICLNVDEKIVSNRMKPNMLMVM